MRSKKAMEITLTLVVAAAILVAILLLSFYFMSRVGKTAKDASGCILKCSAEAPVGCPDGQKLSLQPCTVDVGGEKKAGRCCIEDMV